MASTSSEHAALNRGTGFLDLDPSIRHIVYRHAGLISGELILLGPRSQRHAGSQYWLADGGQFSLAAGLLRVCKTLNDEVKSFLYANNGIVVLHDHLDYGLGTVARMTPQQCRSLRHLYVQLYDEESGPPACSPTSHRLSIWHGAIRHLLSHAAPKTLTLHLMCDTGDSEATRAVLAPLLASPGTLKSCALRLSSKRRDHLLPLAEGWAARIEGRSEASTGRGFPFLDLPPELRTKILEYTDLVTPYNQIEWTSARGFRVRLPSSNCHSVHGYGPLYQDTDAHDQISLLDGPLHHSLRFLQCQPVSQREAGCFCRSRRSSASPACRCWLPPSSLLRVCRAMYEEAIRILYYHNRIIILSNTDCTSGFLLGDAVSKPTESRRLEPSRFITRHSKHHVLRHLRTLEIVLPRIDNDWRPSTSDPYYLDWQFAVNHLRENANLSNLTIVVHMLSVDRRSVDGYVDEDMKSRAWGHVELLGPLRALQGLARLFIYADWDRSWGSYRHIFWIDWDAEGRLCRRRPASTWQFEAWLERSVMGEKYNSWVLGKRAHGQPSEWLKAEVRKEYLGGRL